MRKTLIGVGTLLVAILLVLGACTPAEFEVISLVSEPSEVVAGETVSVTAVVKNTGGSEGTYVVMLTLDGVTIETKEVAITPGSSKTVTFSMVKDAPGTYEIGVGELSSTFTVKERLSDPKDDLFNIAGESWADFGAYIDITESELSLSNGFYLAKIKLSSPPPTKTDDPSIMIEWDILIDSDCNMGTGDTWPILLNDIGADYLLRLTLVDSTYTGQVINLMTNDWGSIEYEIDGNVVELRFSSETIGEPANFNYVVAVRKYGEWGAPQALQVADKAPNEGHYVFPNHHFP